MLPTEPRDSAKILCEDLPVDTGLSETSSQQVCAGPAMISFKRSYLCRGWVPPTRGGSAGDPATETESFRESYFEILPTHLARDPAKIIPQTFCAGRGPSQDPRGFPSYLVVPYRS